MSSLIGNLYVRIGADTSELTRGVNDIGESVSRVGASAGRMGSQLTRNVTAPLLAVGAAAIAMGEQVQDGLRTIRRGTGATGEDLHELEAVFRSVAGTVPASLAEVGTAVADLNTRTGATGETLEGMARSILQLAHVTEEDVGSLISSTTRLFGDWGVATEDQADSLDYLFRVSQATGIGISKLADTSTNFGVQLRALGLNMEEAAALLGTWEKEGVATEKILSGLSMGVRKLSEQATEMGTSIGEEFVNLRTQIQEADEAQAIQIATMAFGARAGADMALAIREGRLQFEDFARAMTRGTDSIGKASAETVSFGEAMGMIGQKIALAAEPLGVVLVDAFHQLQPAIEAVIGFVARAIKWFSDLPQPVQTVAVAVGGLAAALGPLLMGFGAVISTIGPMIPVLAKVAVWIGNIHPVVFALTAVVTASVLVWKTWGDDITRFVGAVWDAISRFGRQVVASAQETVEAWIRDWRRLRTFVSDFTEGVVDLVTEMISSIVETITGGLRRAAEAVRESLGRVTDLFRGMARTIVGNSIVPDMVDAVVIEFGRMDRELMALTTQTVTGVSEQWRQGADEVAAKTDGLATRVLRNFDRLSVHLPASIQSTLSVARDLWSEWADDLGEIVRGARLGVVADMDELAARILRTLDDLGVTLPASVESTLSTARDLWRDWGDDLVRILQGVWKQAQAIFQQMGQAAAPSQLQQSSFGGQQGGTGGWGQFPQEQRGGVSGFVESIGKGVGDMLAGIFGGGGDIKGLADQIVVTTVWLGEALISRLDPMLVKLNEIAYWAVIQSTDVKNVELRISELRDALQETALQAKASADSTQLSHGILEGLVEAVAGAEAAIVDAVRAGAQQVADALRSAIPGPSAPPALAARAGGGGGGGGGIVVHVHNQFPSGVMATEQQVRTASELGAMSGIDKALGQRRTKSERAGI